ncbi:MAG: DHH family phosphoesterase, partial [Butyrivibrio sp.]|nr:DHH family phosphoesterase [Butyrivibrio sp.]
MAKWMVKMKKSDFDATAKKFGIRNITARLLTNRGVITDEEVDSFLNADTSMLHAPEEMADMEEGARLMLSKIEEGARIRVIGDYDVDGICSSFILVKGLKLFGADVDYVLPDRVKDGYGLSVKLVDDAYSAGRNMIITCDNGIAAFDQVAHAKELGMTVIVTDHHEVPFVTEGSEEELGKEILPPADACIDPKRAEGNCSFKEICGAVVAYKFLQMMADVSGCYTEKKYTDFFHEMLIFAGIATVCDVMELRDENRIIVRQSLERISDTSNKGLRALINVNNLDASAMSAYHYGFIIGPCLNATGRLEQAGRALALFLEEDSDTAARMAADLKDMNDSRKDLT